MSWAPVIQCRHLHGTHTAIQREIRRLLGDQWLDHSRAGLAMASDPAPGVWPVDRGPRAFAAIWARGFKFWMHVERGLMAEHATGRSFRVADRAHLMTNTQTKRSQ